MPEIADGETVEVKGSAAKPYLLTNTGGVYSCSCPAWRNQSTPIERRTCKHLRMYRGDAAEEERLGGELPARAVKSSSNTTGPPVLLAHSWDNAQDLSGWWISEKLDGVRAYWDGTKFLSRQGNEFMAPDWFVEGLPSTPLDGELWLDRKAFQRTISIVRRQDRSDHWKQIRYLVFDAPAETTPFEQRVALLKDQFSAESLPYAELLQHSLCTGEEHLRNELARVEGLGGEGLMLREPGSKYEVGRSATLLKIKSFHDAEATVIDHQAGKGKHKGRLGALVVRLPDGTEFSVGTGFSDKQREQPPEIGSIVTFRYQELTDGGVPRFPSFVRAATGDGLQSTMEAATKRSSPAGSSTKAAVAAPVRSEATDEGKWYFEFSDENSSKFWEIAMSGSGSDVAVRYGRIGTNGTIKTKSFADASAAEKYAAKLIEEKTGKGYEEIS